MSVLLIAEHNNKEIKPFTLNAISAASQIKVEEPPKRKAGIKVSSVAELVQKLKNEAKVN